MTMANDPGLELRALSRVVDGMIGGGYRVVATSLPGLRADEVITSISQGGRAICLWGETEKVLIERVDHVCIDSEAISFFVVDSAGEHCVLTVRSPD